MAEHQPAELIPRETAAPQEEAVASELVDEALEPAPLNLRVLVADSVESDRFSLTSILRRIDPLIETLEAANGPQAERVLRERSIDIGSSTGACRASTAARCRTGQAPASSAACSCSSPSGSCRAGPRSRR
jgi:hypothetical protein